MPRSQGTSRKGKPGKKERESGMGKALQKAQGPRYKPKMNGKSQGGGGMAMTHGVKSIGIEVQEDRTRSVLDMHDLDDFLAQADLANREFLSEREGLVVLDETGQAYKPPSVQWEDQKSDFIFTELSVPRRPPWDDTTSPEELEHNEHQSFLEWRRAIAAKEEELVRLQSVASVTPFEKNIEVWRQLWRVMERCSVLLQLVDARNPLFYLSADLRDYAQSLGKPMMVLINKSDYLSPSQRAQWRDYLLHHGWDPVFFSATMEQKKIDDASQLERRLAELAELRRDDIVSPENEEEENAEEEVEKTTEQPSEKDSAELGNPPPPVESSDGFGVDMPLTREQLMDTMAVFARKHDCQPDPKSSRIQFGMVGFPNVGKSSVINVLVGSSKNAHGVVRVAVASQPGKTKHFQTLLLPDSDEMMLCDCPGLVFPSFVSNTADLIAAGVYPIAQMRDHWPVVNLICQRIPREILNARYGIHIPTPSLQDLKERGLIEVPPPTGEEFLTVLCHARGMLAASSGNPDYTRGSRQVIRDYAAGKLLYCHAPPNVEDVAGFMRETVNTALSNASKLKERIQKQLEKVEDFAMEPETTADGDLMDVLDDEDLLGLLDGAPAAEATEIKQKSKRKWGKKNRKHRNQDPYGCHSTEDGLLEAVEEASHGVIIKSGKKHGKKTYTRPMGYGVVS